MSTTRQPGYYWVKYKGEWQVEYWNGERWRDKFYGPHPTPDSDFDEIHPIPVDPEPTAQFHSTDKLLEVAGESWDASERRNEHKHKKYPDAFNYTLSDKTIPTKEQYLLQLKQSLGEEGS